MNYEKTLHFQVSVSSIRLAINSQRTITTSGWQLSFVIDILKAKVLLIRKQFIIKVCHNFWPNKEVCELNQLELLLFLILGRAKEGYRIYDRSVLYFYLQCLVTPYSWLLQLQEKDWSRTYTSWTSPSCSCRHGVHDFHKFMGHWLIKRHPPSFGCGFTKYSYIGCLNKTIMHCFHFLYFVLKRRFYYFCLG